MEITEIKRRLSILDVARRLGIEANRQRQACCPLHEDGTPSLVLYPRTGSWYCFGCGVGGDVIELIQRVGKLTKAEALKTATEWAEEGLPTETGLSTPSISLTEKAEPTLSAEERTELLTQFYHFCQGTLRRNAEAQAYLDERGLSPLTDVGYNAGNFQHQDKHKTLIPSLLELGLLIPSGKAHPEYYIFARYCVVFPLRNAAGEIVSLYGRSVKPDSEGRHFYLTDRQGLYPNYPPPDTKRLILTESVIDAASIELWLRSIPHTEHTQVLAMFGVHGLSGEHKLLLQSMDSLDEIILFFDGDTAGQQAITRTHKIIAELTSATISAVETPNGSDPNQLWTQTDATDQLKTLLKNRKPLTTNEVNTEKTTQKSTENAPLSLAEQHSETASEPKSENPTPEVPALPANPEVHLPTIDIGSNTKITTEKKSEKSPEAPTPASELKFEFDSRNPKQLIFKTVQLEFTIRNGVNPSRLDQLRVALKIERTDGTYRPLRDTLNLYQYRAVEHLVEQLQEQLGLEPGVARQTVDRLTETLETYQQQAAVPERKGQTIKVLSPEAYAQAMQWLQAPDLWSQLQIDLKHIGIIGDLTPALISYLAFTSRKLHDPLHLVYMGSSGSGKTHVQSNISALMPPEEVIDVTALSDKALYYFGERELSHKLLTLEDLSGVSEQVLYPLRELQSKQKLSNISPQKDRHDRLDNATKVVYGPVATSVCTTWEQLYEDNANRSLPLWIDSYPAHNQSVMDYQRRLAAGQVDLTRQRAVVESHRNLQRLLAVVRVLNPFAPQITLPPSVSKPLRSQRLLLACVEAMTCLHQHQRERRTANGLTYIVATKQDNILTLRLLAPVLLHKSDELSPASRRFFEQLKTWLEAQGQTTFYGPQVRKALKIKPSTLNRYLMDLKAYGLLIVESTSKKQGYAYSIPHWNEYSALSAQLQQHVEQVIGHINTTEEVLSIPPVPSATAPNGVTSQ